MSRLAALLPTIRLATFMALVAACTGRDTTQRAADVLFSINGGRVTGPDSIAAGWTRVRVEEDGGGHRLVIFRLADSANELERTQFLAALDTANSTPRSALALGGPEVGDTGEVVVELTPGRYVLGCVRRDSSGHRHASTGEAKALVVSGAPPGGRERPPTATQELKLIDFAYVGPERWPAGRHMLRVSNDGTQDHQLILARLRPGASMSDWMQAGDSDDLATPLVGVARMGPGAIAYAPMELSAGEYVAYCLIPEAKSARPHLLLGMVRAIHVE